jgi:glutamate dehydrogenase
MADEGVQAVRPARGAGSYSCDSLTQAFARAKGRAVLAAEREFVEQLHEDYAPADLPQLTPADFGALAVDLWAFCGAHPAPKAPAIRLTEARGEGGRALGLDLLQIVQGDRPFLVDSVMGELVGQALSIRAMMHPVIKGKAGARSVIAVLMDPLDETQRSAILTSLGAVLDDVYAAVEDFPAMLGLMGRTLAELERAAPDGSHKAEALALLRWLEAQHFVFLGARVYDYPRAKNGRWAHEQPVFEAESGLGVLRDPGRGVLRRDNEPAVLSSTLRKVMDAAEPLVVAKANIVSRVHRRVYMDYVGIKRYGADGEPVGEVRFVGLFTAEAYHEPVPKVPLIRHKVANVLARAGKAPSSHDQRRLNNVLESYPRDELFQISEDELLQIAQGVVHLYDRPRLKLFVRRDPFDRFVSILLYVPKALFGVGVTAKAGAILARAWGGRLSAYYPAFSDLPLARTHYIVGLSPGGHPEPEIEALEAEIAAAVRTWRDRFEEVLRDTGDRMLAAEVHARYGQAFPPGYQDLFAPEEALADLEVIETLGPQRPVAVRAYRAAGHADDGFRFKLYRLDEAAPLSDVLPIVECMGLKALVEHGFELKPTGGRPVWAHELILRRGAHERLDIADVKGPFEAAFMAVWSGLTENDGFNRLVFELGVGWREAALMRALARYRQQSGLDPSQGVQEQALADNPAIARLILDLFRTKFDPALAAALEARRDMAEAIFAEIESALQAVVSLDADRVLRRLALVVRAMVRTNYYQLNDQGAPKPYISFKVRSQDLLDLPAPKPYREIFIWSPQVEGVHLRFGPVARGGLRWSDRRDDFRTEVLGLVKAQQVKNAVIVPVGAKGGFYPKLLPKGPADAVRAEGVAAYKTFLQGLLDITDNLDAAGRVIPPVGVIRHDGDDPYLVVAADKGTATFSDIANGMAEQYGFWLGDAFASGGSAGYDHKAMGITARGAWEAVKRHFRELGKDIQKQDFSCIGVGDMSGDVFGNGMLLSKATRLLAAFDHRDIFIDPDPDPAKSWTERKRLFALPRSSWQDYDKALISKGGGVFSRQAKAIPLSAEMRALLEVKDADLAPNELIRAILKAPAELLYLGGIGTYIKAPGQAHAEVGDKANDAVRVDATELRVAVVCEGANLGVTQAGRIAFARAGGRIDTDAIDNSAGVDTSDHEVNIKILTAALQAQGKLTRPARDKLLQSMTDEVAAHVLQHNHDQTLALSLMEQNGAAELDHYAVFMNDLVAAGRLDRAVEGLPGAAAMAELRKAGKGLTRPELAVLLAYGKLELSAAIVASTAPDDPFFDGALEAYFPKALRPYAEAMRAHRLRREIIATSLANAIIDIGGPTFPTRLMSAAGCDAKGLVTAFEAAWRVFRLEEAWAAITALDGAGVPAAAQLALYQETALVQRRQAYWLARRVGTDVGVQTLVDAYRPAADEMRAQGLAVLSPLERRLAEERAQRFVDAGAPLALAVDIASLRALTSTSDLADLAVAAGWALLPAGRIYHQTGAAFGFDRLRAAAGSLWAADSYERQAVRQLIEDFLSEQAAVARSVMAGAARDTGRGGPEEAHAAVRAWAAPRAAGIDPTLRLIANIEASGEPWSFAKLTIVNAAMRQLAALATG